ncbi:MAG: hypothetical protein ACSHYF_14295 [Verrucomicrobiaceae bacterium]
MSDYHELILNNPDVELIHLSADQSKKAAEDWAKKENFPWPTVLSTSLSESLEARVGQTLPGYFLYSADGELLAKGKEDAFKKIR